MAIEPKVRVTVNPGRVVHMGDFAFREDDVIAVPKEHADELNKAGNTRPEGDPKPAAPAAAAA
jgi:hypothetical protein